MEFGKKERDLIIGLVGVVMAILVWFLVASPYREKTATVQAENDTLEPTVQEYEAVASRITEYQDGMVALEQEKAQIIAKYPSLVNRVDEIMFWANIDKEYPGQLVTGDIVMSELETVDVEAPEVVTAVQYDEEGNEVESQDDIVADNTSDPSVILFKLPINIEFVSTYEGMKDIWDYLDRQNDKNGLAAMEVEYDPATGNLHGNFDVNLYFMTGTEKEYTETFVPFTVTGLPDVFKTTGVGLELGENADGAEQ